MKIDNDAESGSKNHSTRVNAESGSKNHTLIELTGSGYVTNGTFSHANDVFRFTKTNNSTSFQRHDTKLIIRSFLLDHKTV